MKSLSKLNINQSFRIWLISREYKFHWNFGISAKAVHASKTDVLLASCCLHGLLHLAGKPSMYCDCMD